MGNSQSLTCPKIEKRRYNDLVSALDEVTQSYFNLAKFVVEKQFPEQLEGLTPLDETNLDTLKTYISFGTLSSIVDFNNLLNRYATYERTKKINELVSVFNKLASLREALSKELHKLCVNS